MTQRKDGRWQKVITINGKKKTFYSTEPTEKRAERDIQKKILEYDSALHTDKHRFGNIVENVLEDKRQEVENQTYQCYYYAAKHLSPFYDDNIEDISPIQFRAFLDDLARGGRSKSQIQKIRIVASLACDNAILNGINIINFAQLIKLPKKAKKPEQKKPISDDEIAAIVHNASLPFGMFAFLLLFTGMRRGELLALQKQDIDFERNIIKVTKAVEYPSNQAVIKTPKTENSIRDIPIMPFIKDSLQEYINPLAPTDFLFEGETPISKTAVRKRWLSYTKLSGINATPHQLRHTFSNLAYRSGTDAKTHQGLLGHSNVQTSLNIYTSFDHDMQAQSISKTNNLVEKILSK